MKMQDKRSKDQLNKLTHKESLQNVKRKKRGEPILERSFDIKKGNPEILIVCEGKNTEKDYFEKFKIPTLTLRVIGVGDNTLSLVKKTIEKRDDKPVGYYQEVWCVFDADPKADNPKQLINFNNAIFLAKQNDIKVAYSHQAFEYWLLLHFNDYQGEPMDRKLYKDRLNKFLSPYDLKYDDSNDERGKSISNEFFEVLLAYDKGKRRICQAIKRAERIYENLENKENPSKCESSTTVFYLVKRILGIEDEEELSCEELEF
ncbi:RloB family protein [Flavobacterium covae]|uniref:RloB family protein n=2 Tax=Flavobacterium covae TaxID=2906076 RepID=UPI000745DFA2|nr:RloB family protein [Flavobacterium covae]AMA48423.1 hypothetical protein AWN65_02575 [Flavobacterium covae]